MSTFVHASPSSHSNVPSPSASMSGCSQPQAPGSALSGLEGQPSQASPRSSWSSSVCSEFGSRGQLSQSPPMPSPSKSFRTLHTPSAVLPSATLQAEQRGSAPASQALSQQTPSTQNLVSHSPAPLQTSPCDPTRPKT